MYRDRYMYTCVRMYVCICSCALLLENHRFHCHHPQHHYRVAANKTEITPILRLSSISATTNYIEHHPFNIHPTQSKIAQHTKSPFSGYI